MVIIFTLWMNGDVILEHIFLLDKYPKELTLLQTLFLPCLRVLVDSIFCAISPYADFGSIAFTQVGFTHMKA